MVTLFGGLKRTADRCRKISRSPSVRAAQHAIGEAAGMRFRNAVLDCCSPAIGDYRKMIHLVGAVPAITHAKLRERFGRTCQLSPT